MKYTIADVKTYEHVTDEIFDSVREAKDAFNKMENTKGLFIMCVAREYSEETQRRLDELEKAELKIDLSR